MKSSILIAIIGASTQGILNYVTSMPGLYTSSDMIMGIIEGIILECIIAMIISLTVIPFYITVVIEQYLHLEYKYPDNVNTL